MNQVQTNLLQALRQIRKRNKVTRERALIQMASDRINAQPKGATLKEIAEQTGLSSNTIKRLKTLSLTKAGHEYEPQCSTVTTVLFNLD